MEEEGDGHFRYQPTKKDPRKRLDLQPFANPNTPSIEDHRSTACVPNVA